MKKIDLKCVSYEIGFGSNKVKVVLKGLSSHAFRNYPVEKTERLMQEIADMAALKLENFIEMEELPRPLIESTAF